MHIPCPYCGERDFHEFVYRGDARPVRPQPEAPFEAMFEYVYIRENPAGPLLEHWYHAHGCRQWIVVERDTRTHQIVQPTSATP